MMPEFQVSSPTFSLWQRVRLNYHYENFHDTEDEGIVIGFFYSPNGYYQLKSFGWIYYVYWLSTPSSPWVKTPYINEVLEEDIVLNEPDAAVEAE